MEFGRQNCDEGPSSHSFSSCFGQTWSGPTMLKPSAIPIRMTYTVPTTIQSPHHIAGGVLIPASPIWGLAKKWCGFLLWGTYEVEGAGIISFLLTAEKREAYGNQMTYPRSQNQTMAEVGYKPSFLTAYNLLTKPHSEKYIPRGGPRRSAHQVSQERLKTVWGEW